MKRFFCLIGKNGLITTKCKISWINCTNEKKYVAVRAALEVVALEDRTIISRPWGALKPCSTLYFPNAGPDVVSGAIETHL